jgi:hypothetical protein
MPIDTNIDDLMSRARPIGLKAVHISLYTGVSTAALSMAINHQKNLDYLSEWRPVESFISDCEKITRRSGVIPDWKNAEVIKARLAELEAERRDPPKMPTADDFKLMQAVGKSGTGFVDIAREMNCSVSDLLELLEAANRRFSFMNHQMSSWTDARKAHVDLVEKELEERKASRQ